MKALINGITIGYDDRGSGPAICLIHGFPLDRRMWGPQVIALASAGYRVITPDLRGFGESDVPHGPFSMDIFADDMVALIDHLDIGRAIVGGMSMGGYVLLNLLERYPARVAAACFIVSRSGVDDEAGKERRLSMAREVMKSGPRMVADQFEKILFVTKTAKARPELVAEVYGWMMEKDAAGVAGGLLAMRGRKDYTGLLNSFHLPTLVIGAEEDQAVPAENARTLAQGLPQSRLCIIPGAGHLANLEQPNAFNNCLIEFLRGLSPG
jgi:pimeloyl-ACP methyl ester carboxylesterase